MQNVLAVGVAEGRPRDQLGGMPDAHVEGVVAAEHHPVAADPPCDRSTARVARVLDPACLRRSFWNGAPSQPNDLANVPFRKSSPYDAAEAPSCTQQQGQTLPTHWQTNVFSDD